MAADWTLPPGLGQLTGSLQALVDFLRIDDALVEAAAETSPPLTADGDCSAEVKAWIESLSTADKDSLLFRLTQEPPMAVQREILRRFRQARPPQPIAQVSEQNEQQPQ